MKKENVTCLKKWILEKELSDSEKSEIRNVISAFSEFIVATNPNYLYNKSYLEAFIDDFIGCKEMLKKKYDILNKQIKNKLENAGIDGEDRKVCIDNTWLYEHDKIVLLNSFSNVCSKKMKYDIEYLGNNAFAVANEVDLDKAYEKILKKDIDLFIEKYKGVKESAQQTNNNGEITK